MMRLRISGPARDDLSRILATSLERWGEAGRARYAALLAAALRTIAGNPQPSATRERAEVLAGLRSLHIRHVRGAHRVKDPVHVIFYRLDADLVEVMRVLHERMEPTLHVATATQRGQKPRRR